VITVERLQVAPVKGLAALSRRQIELEADGVAEDRRVLLLHADGSVVTMRRHPELVQVVPDLDLAAGRIAVRLPDGTVACSPLDEAGEPIVSTLFGKERTGRVLPGAVAQALSGFAGEPLRVVVAESTGVGWDEGPVSLISRASAVAVGSPDDGPGLPRYRMLIEVDGDSPFVEDGWVGAEVSLGTARIRISHSLDRCLVINHSPVTGKKDWPGLKTLAASRGPDRLTLGVIASVERPGIVRVGDEVVVG
jgi:uncharacterized protein YcbX